MPKNTICPYCGGARVQISYEKGGHGCLFFLLFGIWYVIWVILKWIFGAAVFLFYDWWMSIVHAALGKSHIWICKKWFTGRTKTYYCHDCGKNFSA